jgi:hypothetical protein
MGSPAVVNRRGIRAVVLFTDVGEKWKLTVYGGSLGQESAGEHGVGGALPFECWTEVGARWVELSSELNWAAMADGREPCTCLDRLKVVVLSDAWRRRERGPRAATVDSGGSAPTVARERRARPVVGRCNRGTHEGGRFQLAWPLWAGYWASYHWLKRIVTFFI